MALRGIFLFDFTPISAKFIVLNTCNMKQILICLFAICLASRAEAQRMPESINKSPRIEITINSDWTFNYFPEEKAGEGYEGINTDDYRWPAISIPHTWMTYETTGDIHPFIRNASETDNPYWWNGWGWYRKRFEIGKNLNNKRIFVEFDGVQKYCKVWINGKYLGDHKGGYGSFDFDLTPHLLPGKENVLAVAVNNKRNDQYRIPPMAAGNFNVYGGIYRDVRIVIKENLYIPMQGSASHEGGTFITTPEVSASKGVVRIQTWIKNDYSGQKNCNLNTYIIDASGKIIQTIKSKGSIKPGELYRFDQYSKQIKNPRLWSPDSPYLYTVYSEVTDGQNVMDGLISPLGFRWFRWDYKENFLYVNGIRTPLHGGNRHQEYPWLGDAIPKWITIMDLKDIAENLNYNFMRTSHYPNDKLVYDLADRYGIVISEESPSIKNQDFSPEVQEIQMKEMIRRDRNHPGIMFWSMGNETNRAVDSKYAVAEDTTRIITARRVSGGSEGLFAPHNDGNLPIENLLRCTVRGWYNKDVKDLEPSDPQHSGTEEHHVNMLIASKLFNGGNLSTWLYQDHGADREYLNSPLLHVNPKGYVDLYRIPKYAYFFWQANFSEKPMVFIEPHFWREQYIGQKKEIRIYSNCERVELKVNGISLGILNPTVENFHTVVFKDVLVERGKISVTGFSGNSQVSGEIIMAGEPAKLLLTSSHSEIEADKASVAIIKADITDAAGNHVYGAVNPVRWTVSGPATLVGPAVYEPDVMKNQYMDGVWYIDMPVANVIRSTGKPGKIRITISASGLVSATLEITAEAKNVENTSIKEPALSDDGRRPVTRLNIVTERLDDIPREIIERNSDLDFGIQNSGEYQRRIRDQIKKENPGCDTTSVEFRALTRLFATYLANNSGRLIADDYNFTIDLYNNCRLIAGYVEATKLPPLFKETLRAFYAESIITGGMHKNAGDEMNWMNWIPSGGTVVVSQQSNENKWPRGTIITSKTSLGDLISEVYPQFTKYGNDARDRALTFVAKMNPYVITEVKTGTGGAKTTEYSVIIGRPVLIPLIKFISE